MRSTSRRQAALRGIFLCGLFILSSALFPSVSLGQEGRALGKSAHEEEAGSRGPVDILSILKADPFDPKRGEGRIIETPEGIEGKEEIERKYVLYGLVTAGDIKEAYIGLRERPKGDKKEYRRVMEGDLVDGWKVVEIGGRGVRLSSKGKKVFLRVFDQARPGRYVDRPAGLATPKSRAGSTRKRSGVPGFQQVRKKGKGSAEARSISRPAETGPRDRGKKLAVPSGFNHETREKSRAGHSVPFPSPPMPNPGGQGGR